MITINKKTLLYSAIVATYVFLIIGFFFIKTDPRADELNQLLSDNPELAPYSYKYRVMQVQEDTAIMASPRSSQVSALHALSLIYPALGFKSENSPEMIKAQKEMAHYQKIAAKQIRQQSDISTIRWQIDKAWFTKHGVDVERLCDLHNLKNS